MAVSNVELIVNAVKAINPLRKVEQQSKKVERAVEKMRDAVKKIGPAFEQVKAKAVSALKRIEERAKKAAASFKGFGKAAAIAAASATALAGLRFAFMQAGELERQTKSLQVLTGSLEKAKGIIAELQAFGAVTPFTSQELIETAKRMKAFGFETNKVVGITKRLADVAGATGADLGGIATAFGQIQAKGRLQGEELLQLQERGVALQDELRKMYGLTGEEFSKALSKGRIGAESVEAALIRLTEKGGKYANGAIAQSDTLLGKLSTLQDAIGRLGQNIGKVLSPVFKFLITQITNLTNSINNLFAGIEARRAEIQLLRDQGLKGGNLRRAIQSPEFRERVQQRLQAQTTIAEPPAATIPALLGGNAGIGRANKATKERVDASKELLDLNTQLFGGTEQLSELEKINLRFQIQRQKILDRDLGANAEKIALLRAQAGFEADLLSYREDQIRLEEQAANLAESERKKREAEEKRRLEADPGYQMRQQLEELLKLENQVAGGATAIGNAFSNSFKNVITGSKSAQEALADMMSSVAEHFMDMAAQIIAKQLAMITYGLIMKALGVGAAAASTNTPPTTIPDAATPGSGLSIEGVGDVGISPGANLAAKGAYFDGQTAMFAKGGIVSAPTPFKFSDGGTIKNGLMGEAGPEAIIPLKRGPDGKLGVSITDTRAQLALQAEAMRGNITTNDLPESADAATRKQLARQSDALRANTATRQQLIQQQNNMAINSTREIERTSPLDIRFESTVINNTEYVTAEQHRQGMAQAAEQGRALTLQALQNSVKSRRKVGLA